MEVNDFEVLVIEAREYLRNVFNKYDDFNIAVIKDDILGYFNQCCSKFEEDTLIENLKEEFGEIIKGEVA